MAQAKRFYSLVVNGAEADLDIYGDITSEAWRRSDADVSAYSLSQQLAALEGVSLINVNINSYGGEVAEGIAIYNALKRHSAKIVTRCDGMACSIASVIFMAGDERIMYAPSMLMIHNASCMEWGTAAELRKAADDLEKITSMSVAAYMENVSISEEELHDLMDAETWLSPAEALNMGFCTSIEAHEETGLTQSALGSLVALIERRVAADAGQRQAADPEPPALEESDPEPPAQSGDDDPEPPDVDDDADDDPEPPDTDDGEEIDLDEDDPDEDDPMERKSEQAFRSFISAAFNH